MNFYYGIRPTGDNLHLGHIMSLLNMFNEVKNNLSNVSNIYILMAETHAEISTLSIETIRNNSKLLTNKIISLFKSYLLINNINSINILDKVKFIYQNDPIGHLHRDITYKYTPLVNTNNLLTNPVYVLNSTDNSLAFLIYPILQAFDVLLYTSEHEETVVFVSGDQKSNVNTMKDIYSKLKIPIKIKFIIYDNVIYDYKCKDKMSKSLNNFINFDNADEISNYLMKYKTFPRAQKTDCGDFTSCPFFSNLISFLQIYLNCNFDHVKMCNGGTIGCYECKSIINRYIRGLIDKYIEFQQVEHDINFVDENLVRDNYKRISFLIDKTRSKEV